MGRHKRTLRIGNWFFRFDGFWSESADRVFKENSRTSSEKEDMELLAIKRLAEELYFAVLPRQLRKLARQNSKEVRDEINHFLIDEVGRGNILCDPSGYIMDRLPEKSIILGEDLFLIPFGTANGMPLWDYLKWYILAERKNSRRIKRALEEWSGIPERLQETVYETVIDFFRDCLIDEHAKEDKYGRPRWSSD